MENKTERLQTLVTPATLKRMDRAWKSGGFRSRSAWIAEAINVMLSFAGTQAAIIIDKKTKGGKNVS